MPLMEKQKNIILISCGYYLPGKFAGGPIRSISNIVAALGDEFEIRVIASNHDLNSRDAYIGISDNSWNVVGKALVRYFPRGIRSFFGIFSVIRELRYDIIYLNSFFSIKYTIFPLILMKMGLLARQPILLAPRGEFSESALNIKFFRKQIYIKFAKLLGLYSNIYWHASTDLEKRDIQRSFGVTRESIATTKVIVAADLVVQDEAVDDALSRTDPSRMTKENQHTNLVKICFLSRIARMKNLLFALQVLLDVKVRVEFNIYGPPEDSFYWSECKNAISCFPSTMRIQYHGPVDRCNVIETIRSHDLFFLPTLGENFGHVIVESWLAGVPVLISDKTPWVDLRVKGLGWDLPLDNKEAFIAAIHELSELSLEGRAVMRETCRKFALDLSSNFDAVQSNRILFNRVISRLDVR